MELIEIKNLLLSDKIDYKQALEEIKKLPKPWHTKEWKEKRLIYLKPVCENCGSVKKPLIIQHTKRPKSFTSHFNSVFQEMFNKEIKNIKLQNKSISNSEVEEYLKQYSVEREACPICKKISLRIRKHMSPPYVCSKNHVFETPIKIIYYTDCMTTDLEQAQKYAVKNLNYKYYCEETKKLKAQSDFVIGKKALLNSIDDSIEYRDFKHIKTCCKRCAAKEDERYIEKNLYKQILKNAELYFGKQKELSFIKN